MLRLWRSCRFPFLPSRSWWPLRPMRFQIHRLLQHQCRHGRPSPWRHDALVRQRSPGQPVCDSGGSWAGAECRFHHYGTWQSTSRPAIRLIHSHRISWPPSDQQCPLLRARHRSRSRDSHFLFSEHSSIRLGFHDVALRHDQGSVRVRAGSPAAARCRRCLRLQPASAFPDPALHNRLILADSLGCPFDGSSASEFQPSSPAVMRGILLLFHASPP